MFLQLWQPYPVEFTRNLVFDQYNRWHPRSEENSPVVFIDIDEASLAKLGQFPWPRSTFATMVEKMTGYGSAAIAFDILFTEADRTAPSEILPFGKACVLPAAHKTGKACVAPLRRKLPIPTMLLPAP